METSEHASGQGEGLPKGIRRGGRFDSFLDLAPDELDCDRRCASDERHRTIAKGPDDGTALDAHKCRRYIGGEAQKRARRTCQTMVTDTALVRVRTCIGLMPCAWSWVGSIIACTALLQVDDAWRSSRQKRTLEGYQPMFGAD